MTTETTKPPLASEGGHFYDRKTGAAVYEVAMTSKAGMRPTNIGDARKLDLAPSVTKVCNDVIRKPGLESWMATQLLQASLTLPKQQGETLDAYAKRVIEDSKAQGIAAAQRGTDLHKAIETYIQYKALPIDVEPLWGAHCCAVQKVLAQHGIDLLAGQPEHSFSQQIDGNWYGGKIDYHATSDVIDIQGSLARENILVSHSLPIVLDFKSKDKIEPKKQLVWDEHVMQIAAYAYGLFGVVTTNKAWKWEAFRGINVFVGVNDCEIRVHEHKPEDLAHGFELFRSILDFWTRKNYSGKYSK